MTTTRITRSDLRRAFEYHELALRRHGLLPDDHRLGLQIGSATYGNAYRLYVLHPGESGHYGPPIGSDYLGMTAREAHHELASRTRAIGDVFYVLRQADAS